MNNTTGKLSYLRCCASGAAWLVLALLMLISPVLRADLAVVVNPQNALDALDERDVVDLYMGRFMAFPNGVSALPLDQPIDSEIREQFYQMLTGKSVAQINAYWAKLIFSGRATPPRMARQGDDIIEMVLNNKNAIAYVPLESVTDEVKVVFILKSTDEVDARDRDE